MASTNDTARLAFEHFRDAVKEKLEDITSTVDAYDGAVIGTTGATPEGTTYEHVGDMDHLLHLLAEAHAFIRNDS